MLMRITAAVLNGMLVLALYVGAWGVQSFTMARLEVALSVAAALATWYALRKLGRRATRSRLIDLLANAAYPVDPAGDRR